MKRILAVAMFALSVSAAAQDPKPGRQGVIGTNAPRKAVATESFARCLIAPELIMERQTEIGLDDAQRARIIDEMSRAQAVFTKVQWEVATIQQRITTELRRSTVDESVLKQFDGMLALENELKRTQLALLIRVKNVLTPQQQSQLTRTDTAMEGWVPKGAKVVECSQ